MATSRTLQGSAIWFVALAFVFSWAFWLPEAARTNGVDLPGWLDRLLDGPWNVAAFGPSVAALVMVIWTRPDNLLAFLHGRFLKRFRLWLLLPALALIPAVAALSLWVGTGATGAAQGYAGPGGMTLATSFAAILLTAGPLQEELGWRGWLLPKLQARYAGLTAAIIVGIIWSLWHLPLQFEAGLRGPQYQASLPIIFGSLITLTMVSIIMTWLVNAGNGSVVLAILFHASMNWATFVAFPVFTDQRALGIYTLSLALIAVALILLAGPRKLGQKR